MKKGIGRACVISNGSPLFSGGTTSGEAQIRRYMVEHDLIEAVIALTSDLFYNTNIAIYVFVLSKNKRKERKGKIQLINATDIYKPLQKSLGKKRREITPKQIEEILQIYKDFDKYIDNPTKQCKVFDNEEFLYKEWTVYQPLQRTCLLNKEWVDKLENSELLTNSIFNEVEFEELSETDPRDSKQEKKYQGYIVGKAFCEQVLRVLRENLSDDIEKDYSKFTKKIKSLIKEINGYSDSRLNSICMELSYMDKTAVIQKDRNGKIIVDPSTKDTEIVKLSEDVKEYFKREVYPFIPDAIYSYDYDPNKKGSKEKIGAEIPFTKYFYEYNAPEKSEDLLAAFYELEKDITDRVKKI